MQRIIGVVTEIEKNVVFDLFEKRYALENLMKIEDVNSEKYFKIKEKLNVTMQRMHQWWNTCKTKYNWDEVDMWKINYKTNEIFTE